MGMGERILLAVSVGEVGGWGVRSKAASDRDAQQSIMPHHPL